MKIPAIVPLGHAILFMAICIGGNYWNFPFVICFILSLYMIYIFGSSLLFKEKILSLNFTDDEIFMLKQSKYHKIDLIKIVDYGLQSANASNKLLTEQEIKNNTPVQLEIFYVRTDNPVCEKIKLLLEEPKKPD